MNRYSVFKPLLLTLFSLILSFVCQAQTPYGCFSSDGKFKDCGSSWDDYYNGVAYRCYCNCNTTPPAQCSPKSSSSSSSSSSGSSSGGYSPQVQMMEAILTPLVNNFFKWLSSGPSPKQGQHSNAIIDKKKQEELDRQYEQRQEEYKAMMLAQISNAKSEFEKQNKSSFGEQKESTLNEFKDRLAKSEATKAVKQANCAAFTSLQAANSDLSDISDYKNIRGSAEKMRKEADFTNVNINGCPPVKIDIPEVNAAQPVSIQELFYKYVVHQSDSIRTTIDTLKVKKTRNDQVLEEKKQKVEELQKVIEKQKVEKKPDVVNNQGEDNQLVKDAMKELEAATTELQAAQEEDQKMKDDIALKEKNITALEKMRSTYDIDNKPASTGQTPKN
jgi:hypothetical protein